MRVCGEKSTDFICKYRGGVDAAEPRKCSYEKNYYRPVPERNEKRQQKKKIRQYTLERSFFFLFKKNEYYSVLFYG